MTADGASRPKLTQSAINAYSEVVRGQSGPDPESLSALISEWRPNSPEWKRLANNTKKTWGAALDLIEERWGKSKITLWSDTRMIAKVVLWRDSRAETPRAADMGVTVLRALLEFGRMRGKVTKNAAAGIPNLYQSGGRSDIIWSDDDVKAFIATAGGLGMQHVADGLRLAALSGLRREDLVTLTWAHIQNDTIEKLALKKSKGKRRKVVIPIVPELRSLLDELKLRTRGQGVDTVLVNSRGQSWTGDGFGGSFTRVRDAAKIFHIESETGERRAKHLHDVRGSFCTKLFQHGLTNEQVAGVMGWAPDKVEGIKRSYVDQASVSVALAQRLAGSTVK